MVSVCVMAATKRDARVQLNCLSDFGCILSTYVDLGHCGLGACDTKACTISISIWVVHRSEGENVLREGDSGAERRLPDYVTVLGRIGRFIPSFLQK